MHIKTRQASQLVWMTHLTCMHKGMHSLRDSFCQWKELQLKRTHVFFRLCTGQENFITFLRFSFLPPHIFFSYSEDVH